MLSDRSYMRHEPSRRPPGFLAWFLGVLAAVFVLQRVEEVFFDTDALTHHGALSAFRLRAGEIWTPFTYALLHGSLTHLLLNGVVLFFIGRTLQETLSSARLAWLTVAGTLGGAAAWLAFHFNAPGNVIGASGIGMTYLTVFTCLQPRRNIPLLLFFVIPITVQPLWVLSGLVGIDLLGLLARELPGSGSFYGVAHSVHLGGVLAGWLFYQVVLAPRRSRSGLAIEPPAWLRKRASRPAPAYTVNLDPDAGRAATSAGAFPGPATTAKSRDALKAEVDSILDKISLHGFGSLTEAEKRVLDEARQQLSHR